MIVSGSGRSGTTWLAEVLSSAPYHTLVNEPLKNSNSSRVNDIGFTGWGQHIPDEADWLEAFELFHDLFSGQELNPNYYTSGSPNFKTKLWVHKMIRIPFLLPWLLNNFSTLKPIYLVRNPYAVISSQLRHRGFGKNKMFKKGVHTVVPQFEHHDQFYRKWSDDFECLENYTEKLALHWALENEHVLLHPWCHQKCIVITYEDLTLHPFAVFEKIESEIDINLDFINEDALKKNSYSKIDSIPENMGQQLNKWKDHLTSQQIHSIRNILRKRNFDIYNFETGFLDQEKLSELRSSAKSYSPL